MAQFLGLILILVLIKLLIDYIKPASKKSKPAQGGDFIDISEKWINADEMPYQKNDYLLQKRELVVFQMLKDSLANSPYIVYPHLRLSDMLKVPAAAPNRQEYLYRIQERGLDMVVLESNGLKPILAINFNGPTETKRRQISDQFTEKALHTAGYKYINIDLHNPPNSAQLLDILRGIGLDL